LGASPGGKFGWVAPALLLLTSLLMQNAGLYQGTRYYVRWMDELNEAIPQPAHHVSAAQVATLDDPVAELLGRLALPQLHEVPGGPELWVEVLTSLVAVLWLGWVARLQDLQLWTKVMLSGALLATLKGFLACSTVLPDAAGWDGCRERLGEDGLAYFRQLSGGSAHGHSVSLLQAAQDVCMLSVRSLWMMGRAGRSRVCADTVFSSPTCFCLLLSMGLYDVVRAATEDLEVVRRCRARGLAAALLGALVAADLLLALRSRYHYSLDVTLALPLTLLVYTSPAVALAARCWAEEWPAAVAAVSAALPTSVAPAAAAEAPQQALMDPESSEAALRDLGQAALPPCCCGLGGLYHLRAQPGHPSQRPWTEECERRHQQQLADFADIRAREAGRQRKLQEDIAAEHGRAQELEAQAAAGAERRLAEEARRLAAHEEKVLAEANSRLEAERKAAAALEEKVTADLQHFVHVEAEFGEARTRLEGEAAAFRREAAEAEAAAEEQRALARRHGQEAQVLREYLARLREQLAAAGGFPEAEKPSPAEDLKAAPEEAAAAEHLEGAAAEVQDWLPPEPLKQPPAEPEKEQQADQGPEPPPAA